MTRRTIIWLAIGVPILLVAGIYVALALWTSGAPAPVSLGEPPAAASGGPLDGIWSIKPGPNSFVGYRIRERLGFISAPNDAVGRTHAIAGSLEIRDGTLAEANITADMTSLRSDRAGRDLSMKMDGLQTNTFPEATFELLTPVEIGDPELSQVIAVEIPGRLTLHGVTKQVSFPMDARWNGDSIEVAGQLEIRRTDYEIGLMAAAGLRVAEEGVVEVQLELERGQGTSLAQAREAGQGLRPESPSGSSIADEPIYRGPGTLVATVKARGEPATIWKLSLADGKSTPLSPSGRRLLGDNRAEVSPNGRWLVFDHEVGVPSSSTVQIVAIDLLDGSRRVLTEPNPMQIDQHPRWSPDGSQIAFVRNDSLQLIDFASGQVRELVPGGLVQDAPAWSPDGRRIAFVEFGETGTEDIHVTEVGSGTSERMVRDRGYEYGPAWSPDGRSLVFGRDGDLFRFDIDQGSEKRLTRGDGDDGAPVFSPSGRLIAFQRDTRILILDLRGRGPARRLDMGKRRLSWPAWVDER